jgi:formylglycine-generating enzyme required for sulfatase activity
MMQRAGRLHGFRGLGLLVIVAGLVVSGVVVRRQFMEEQYKTRAAGLVQQLINAETPSVPAIITAMSDDRPWVDPVLKQRFPHLPEGSREQLHAALALLWGDPKQVEYLYGRLLSAGPIELPVIRDGLKPHQRGLVSRLWSVLESTRPDDRRLLPAAAALALYDPAGPRWSATGPSVARALASINPVYLGPWMSALRPVRDTLTEPLAAIFRDTARSESERIQAANILADYASDQPRLLADLLMDADPKPFLVLFEILRSHSQHASILLEAELVNKLAPEATVDARVRHARRQARAAVALARLGQAADIWPLLRHSSDPSVRSYVVHWLKLLEAEPTLLLKKLEEQSRESAPPPAEGRDRMESVLFDRVTSVRRALILALGEYPAPPPHAREALLATLLDAYKNDPDAGIHGAVEWTLRQWKEEQKLAMVVLPKFDERGDRRWYVNSAGQTLVVITGPVEFMMGSPATEPKRDSREELRRRRIDLTFVVATKEVTREQYDRFLQASQGNLVHFTGDVTESSPDRQGPQVGIRWFDAVAYCNWLSAQEHLEPCYLPNDQGEYAEGMQFAADLPGRSGYRLPTEAEWEYVCRAGALSSRYYGGSSDLLGNYGWYVENAPRGQGVGVQAAACARLKPNDLGLFDLLGNAGEWCQDDDEPMGKAISLTIMDKGIRLIRGGTYTKPAELVRSACRDGFRPSGRNSHNGFRIVRTLP